MVVLQISDLGGIGILVLAIIIMVGLIFAAGALSPKTDYQACLGGCAFQAGVVACNKDCQKLLNCGADKNAG